MFVCVPDFEKVTLPLRKPVILIWTTGNVDCLVKEISRIRLCTNSFSREWIYSKVGVVSSYHCTAGHHAVSRSWAVLRWVDAPVSQVMFTVEDKQQSIMAVPN
jgi:hypothetical protein